MTREITYTDDVQIPATDSETVRDVLFTWHDPQNGNYARYYRTEPAIDSDRNVITDADANELYNVQIGVSMTDIAEENLSSQMSNLVDAINNAFPDSWPEVGTAEVTIQ